MKNLQAGEKVELYLARHPGLENAVEYGDLFRALRLPEGTALGQRVRERIRAAERRGGKSPIRVLYVDVQGAIKRVRLWMTKKDAKRVLYEHAARERLRIAKADFAAALTEWPKP